MVLHLFGYPWQNEPGFFGASRGKPEQFLKADGSAIVAECRNIAGVWWGYSLGTVRGLPKTPTGTQWA